LTNSADTPCAPGLCCRPPLLYSYGKLRVPRAVQSPAPRPLAPGTSAPYAPYLPSFFPVALATCSQSVARPALNPPFASHTSLGPFSPFTIISNSTGHQSNILFTAPFSSRSDHRGHHCRLYVKAPYLDGLGSSGSTPVVPSTRRACGKPLATTHRSQRAE
jgi:hypothetical protein